MAKSNVQIEVFAGPAGSGKTLRLLSEYGAELQRAQTELRPGTTLWLAPTIRSCASVKRRLLEQGPAVLFSPNVVTFADFAERILRLAPQHIAPLTAAMRRTLLRRIIGNLLEQKQLEYFSGIAHTSGFLDLVSNLISELKRAEAWPDDFERVARVVSGLDDSLQAATKKPRRGGKGSDAGRPRDRELARIYRAYQELLLTRNVYDGEGRFWSAREALDAGHWGPFEKLSMVVVDGFTDFTHTQYEILSRLAHRVSVGAGNGAGRFLIGLPLEPSPQPRPELFAKSQAVFDRLEKSIPTLFVNFLPDRQLDQKLGGRKSAARPARNAKSLFAEAEPSDGTVPQCQPLPAAIAHVAKWLFANPRETPRAKDASGLEVLAVAGQTGEVQLLAARIKERLHAGGAPEEIVVAIRGLTEYADLVNEIFSAAGIPFALETGTPLRRAPLLRFVISVLQLEAEDWPFTRLRPLLDSSYFRPQWPELESEGRARGVAAVLRKYQLDAGRRQILEILQHELRRQGDGDRETAEELAELRQAFQILQHLSAATERLRKEHDFRGWAEVLSSLAGELCWTANDDGASETPRDAADQLAWGIFKQLLFDAARVESYIGAEPPKLSLAEFLHELSDLVQSETIGSGHGEAGRVLVLEAPQVRNLDVPYLFVAGLTERSFPQHRGDDCLFHEMERREMNRQAFELGERVQLGHRTARTSEEMLLFYGVVTRARRELVLSYPAVNASGEPLSPSPYLQSLVELFEPGAVKRTSDDQLDPIPRVEQLLSDTDIRVRSVYEAIERQPNLFRLWLDDPSRQPVGRNILAAADMALLRFHTQHFTKGEGILENETNRERLRQRYGREHEFSASQLEVFAACPFRFFVAQVLDVQPLPSLESGIDPARRGAVVHDVLAELYARLFDNAEGANSPANLTADELTERFRTLVAEKIGRQIDRTDLQRVLLQVERQLLEECGPPFALQHAGYHAGFESGLSQPLLPRRLEASFGTPHPKSIQSPDAPVFSSLKFGAAENEVRVAGRIDRIDIGQSQDGRQVFSVIDYKTGRKEPHKADEVAAGRELQLALYTLAVQRLEIAGPGAVPLQFGYWKIRGDGFAPAIKTGRRKKGPGFEPLEEAVWMSLVQMLEEIIPRLARGIRQGKFPVASIDPDCTGFCPYGTVCRVNQVRSVSDTHNKFWSP